MNKRALAWGRLAAHDSDAVMNAVAPIMRAATPPEAASDSVAMRVEFLSDYQDEAYAARYRDAVARIAALEDSRLPGRAELRDAVATNLFKLMAYEDEYEAARLYTRPEFREKVARQFEGDYSLRVHLAPPLFSRIDPNTGHARKRAFGPWILRALALLTRFKGLRGGRFDPFGYTKERTTERRLIADYLALLDEFETRLSAKNHKTAVQLARVPEQIRGFGHIKEANVRRAKENESALLAKFRLPQPGLTRAAE